MPQAGIADRQFFSVLEQRTITIWSVEHGAWSGASSALKARAGCSMLAGVGAPFVHCFCAAARHQLVWLCSHVFGSYEHARVPVPGLPAMLAGASAARCLQCMHTCLCIV